MRHNVAWGEKQRGDSAGKKDVKKCGPISLTDVSEVFMAEDGHGSFKCKKWTDVLNFGEGARGCVQMI